MLNSIKTSVRDTIIYGTGNVAVKLVGLLLIPLYTNPDFFSVDDFGIIGVLEISGLLLLTIMTLFVPQSFARWFWDKEHRQNQEGIFFITLVTQIVTAIILSLILIPFSGKFSELLFQTGDLAEIIKLLIISAALQAVNNVINTEMRLRSRSLIFIATNISKLILVLLLTIYLIKSRGEGLKGIYMAQVAGNALFVLILGWYSFKHSKIFTDIKVFREMNSYGMPLFLGTLSAVILSVVDRYALNSMAMLKSVALYTLAFKVVSALKTVIVDSVRFAVGPMILRLMDSPDNKRFNSKILLYSSFVLMTAIIAVSAFSPELIALITKSGEFEKAAMIVPVLAISVFFTNLKEVTIYGLHIAKKSRIIGVIVTISTIVSIGLNILLIPAWDIAGAAVATLLSQFFYWILCYNFSQKYYFIPYEKIKILLLIISGAVLSYIAILIGDLGGFISFFLRFICILSFPFILLLFNFYEKEEIMAIKGFFRKWTVISNLSKNIRSLKDMKDDI